MSGAPEGEAAARKACSTCYLWSEWFFWHDSGSINGFTGEKSIQPLASWENPETKRRLHNLLVTSKLFDKLQHIHLHERHPDVSGTSFSPHLSCKPQWQPAHFAYSILTKQVITPTPSK